MLNGLYSHGDRKLLGNPRDRSHKAELTKEDELFLVNLKEDITEMTNVAEKHPEIVENGLFLRY